ncbi:unnamed protein product [Candidula unifasciata]|uniref:Peptidase S1 domain-containing protein n=1 Tax=Candidula unifasciata TaxID=100452 RepID=A0A8S3YJ39_9EUPU|nr:unnamed protein product [Candidula unifasciata]
MSVLQIQWRVIIVAVMGACLEQYTLAQDICSKFQLDGPCRYPALDRNATYGFLSQPPTPSPYCSLVCSQGNAELYTSVCPCALPVTMVPSTALLYTTTMEATTTTEATTTMAATTTMEATTTPEPTTTTMLTTTPRPVTCFYSSQRPAKLGSIARRMFSSTPVITECDYPGVVALFRENNGLLTFSCMASLLEEDLLLINEKNCLSWVQKYTTYAMADSYQISKVTRAVSVNKTTVARLDTTGSLKSLYTVRLNSKLTLNDGCTQPVCVPNINIPASDIDLEDCHIVGYGDTTSTMGSTPPQLNEIKVRVALSSITKANLTVTRIDGQLGMSCMSDDSAPLICSHKITGEWVTIGITVSIGYPCPKPGFTKPVFASLLQEAPNLAYYNAIQKFKYADPNVFTAYINSTSTY